MGSPTGFEVRPPLRLPWHGWYSPIVARLLRMKYTAVSFHRAGLSRFSFRGTRR